jgi:dolichol-phosphate mannosyltransferase
MLLYLKQKFFAQRLLKFCVVGASGVIVNMGVLYVLVEILKFSYIIASPIAIELSILSNFAVNLIWTWKDRAHNVSFWIKLFRYHIAVGITAFVGNYILLVGLTEFFKVQYMISNLIGIAVGTVFNFIVNDLWTFRNSDS